ncbi:Uncharacterised protein [Vibrio cholerae]|uniref:Uncharacterized protein n=1 Tax=Vibrio cholerae TaxID=666 RepID=A0A655PY45_VIBCL|nr:Uncharacterised protein [Vibrio cholerae]CSA22995.1 Uncharacterised protein [Vibrio cholerae]CSB37329.1 Uncharacterised protein [Vibrio cholerae]CSB54749.1 Uncharacterised protein [Vibrio cholerae]CSB71438.1 Uncharacterised protein [Vibrio cholerae]
MVRSMLKACAINAVATPCMIAVPSMFTVAPSGTVKEATLLSTPKRFFTVSMVTGMVALDDAVENANIIASSILRKNTIGFRPAKVFSINP